MSGKTGPPVAPLRNGVTRRSAIGGLMAAVIAPTVVSKAWGAARRGEWYSLAPAGGLLPRLRHASTSLPGGMVLVTGGVHIGVLGSAQIYDPFTNTWISVAPMNVARSDHAAALLPDGKVLVCGGSSSSASSGPSTILASAEVYDPATNTWTVVSPMNTPRSAHSAASVGDGVLITGGVYLAPLSAAELFNGESWVQL